jgi:U4/U6.U5 tri-snRNP component SNU23
MADRKGGGDTVRKTYDREEYSKRAKERQDEERVEGKARYEAKMAGEKYRKRASTPEDMKFASARTSRIAVPKVGSVQLVTGGGVGKKSGVGITCELCGLSYSNNHEFLDHVQSPQHMRLAGIRFEVERATLEDVRNRLRWLSRKRKEASQGEELDLNTRLEARKEEEEKAREEKRRKRNEKRRSKKQQDDW